MTKQHENIRRLIGQIADHAHALEMALRNAQEVFEGNDCPEPHERWDDLVEDAGFTAGEIAVGDVGKAIDRAIEGLETLLAELPK